MYITPKLQEQFQLKKMRESYAKYKSCDFIPCLYIYGKDSEKLFIHFHANGEDMNQTLHLIKRINIEFKISVMAVEYPGYGIYKENKASQHARKSEQILKDAETVIEFATTHMKVNIRNIIVSGRSIGSGPACHLAAMYDPLCLILISPIQSVTRIAKQIYGRIAEILVEERFNNASKAQKIKCPTVIIHGIKDALVPYQSSIEFLQNLLTNSMTHLFLRGKMTHNHYQYKDDIISPL